MSGSRIMMRSEWCKGCLLCVKICPRKVFIVDPTGSVPARAASTGEFGVIRPENEKKCIGCRLCELLCPDLAITVETTGEH